MRNIRKIFRVEYDVKNILKNDLDTMMSRIDFTQINEPGLSYWNICYLIGLCDKILLLKTYH